MASEFGNLNPVSFLQDIMGFTQAQQPKSSADKPFKIATIDENYQASSFSIGTLPRVTFDGESTLSEKFYPVLGPYWPHPDDRVVLAPVGTTWIIIGPINRNASSYVGDDLTVAGDTNLGGALNVTGITTLSERIRIPQINDVSLSSTGHAFQIGPTSGVNLRMDANEMQGVNNGAASGITLQKNGGSLTIGGASAQVATTHNGTITATPTQSASSQAIALNHAYGIYADNVNVGGGAGSRLWFDVPDGGDFIIGPRAGTGRVNDLRLRTGATTATSANMFINATTFTIARGGVSALKYKQDIEDFTPGLETITKLRPVTFRDRAVPGMIIDDPEARHLGLIAEEVHGLGLKELVGYHEGEIDSLNYDRVAIVLISGIKELAHQVTELQSELSQLKKKEKKQ